jgi:hypothetical protein
MKLLIAGLLLAPSVALADDTPPRPRPSKVSRILFDNNANLLVPLVCYDGARARFETRDPCLKLLPASARVTLSDGRSAAIKKRTKWLCDGDSSRYAAVELKLGEIAAPWATWPKFEVKTAAEQEPSADELKRVRAAAQETLGHAPKGELQVNAKSLDIDGDGKPERFFDVTAGFHEGEYELSALYFVSGRARDVVELHRSNDDSYSLLGGVDLDGDGRLELIVESSYYEGDATIVESIDDKGNTIELGALGCGS